MGSQLFESHLRNTLEEKQRPPEVSGLRRRNVASASRNDYKESAIPVEGKVSGTCADCPSIRFIDTEGSWWTPCDM